MSLFPSGEKSNGKMASKVVFTATLEVKSCFVIGRKGLGIQAELGGNTNNSVSRWKEGLCHTCHAGRTLLEWTLPLGKAEGEGRVQTGP